MSPYSIESEFIRLIIDPATAGWQVESLEFEQTWLRGLSFGIDYQQGDYKKTWRGGRASEGWEISPAARAEDKLKLSLNISEALLRVDIDFWLESGSRLLRWSLELTSHSQEDLILDRVWLLRAGRRRRPWWDRLWRWARNPEPEHPMIFEGQRGDLWFMDGWQSWSFAGSLSGEQIVTGTRLGPATRPMYINSGAPAASRAARLTSEMYGIAASRSAATGVLIGQVSEQRAYGSIEGWQSQVESGLTLSNALEGLRLKPGATWSSDWAALQFLDLDQAEPHAEYLEEVAKHNEARVEAEAPTGWSSWYYYFNQVTQEDIFSNLDWIEGNQAQFPVHLVQIDDGFEADIGDWLTTNSRFKDGHARLVDQILEAGLTPGLWLAPFIAKPSAEIVRLHPEWILRNRNRRSVRAGYNWGTFFHALDTTHPGVQDYLAEVIETAVNDWGYRYLKLDFLYAASLMGARWDQNKTGAEALRIGLRIIRQAAGEDVFLAGCGCPLGPAIGLVDSMRIGPDVAPGWLPAYQGIETYFRKEPSLPSLRNALHNSIARAALQGRWWQNDPDCLLMRQDETQLDQNEVQLMATVAAMSGGALIFSDNLADLAAERLEWAARLLPTLPGRPIVLDQFQRLRPQRLLRVQSGALGTWWLLALINWSETDQVIHFDAADYGISGGPLTGVDYWNETPVSLIDDQLEASVPAHGVRLFQLRHRRVDEPQWLGDTLHISGGMVVKSWQTEVDTAKAIIDLERQGHGTVWLQLPGDLRHAAFEGRELPIQQLGHQVYSVQLEGITRGRLQFKWVVAGS